MTIAATLDGSATVTGQLTFFIILDASATVLGELTPVTVLRAGTKVNGKLNTITGVTVSRFRYIYREFQDTPPPLIARAISQSELTVNSDLEFYFRNELIEYAVAHRLTLIERGKLVTQGAIGQASRGKQVKFDVNSEEYWLQTEYGRIFWESLTSTGGVGMIMV